jgi:hypothetical protein
LADGDAARLRHYAAELVALVPDTILTSRAAARGNPYHSYRVRECRRSGRRWLCAKPREARK